MSDIFLSYKSEDKPRAKIIAEALEQHGYSVWWDRIIPPGKTFDQVIEEALDASKCVIVLWSKESTISEWVKNEAREGARRHILVPILIDNVKIPFEFRHIQAAQLIDWQGVLPNSEFDLLLKSVGEILGEPPAEKMEVKKRHRKEEEERLLKEIDEKDRLRKEEEERRRKEEEERLWKEREKTFKELMPLITDFFEKVKGFLLEPSKTFDATKGENLKEAIKYYAVIAAIYSAILAILLALEGTSFGSPLMGLIGPGAGVAGAIIFFVLFMILAIIGAFIGGAVLHIFVYIVGGRNGIAQTIKVVLYGSTPLLLGWIPIISFIFAIWSLILGILGIRQLHELTTGKAILAVVLFITVVFVLPIILLMILASMFGARSYYY
ncbi:MAG TPA: TIR domain-containing protein [Candidatus Methanoperedens sp.]